MMFIGTFTQAGAYKFFFVKYILCDDSAEHLQKEKLEIKNIVKPNQLIWVRKLLSLPTPNHLSATSPMPLTVWCLDTVLGHVWSTSQPSARDVDLSGGATRLVVSLTLESGDRQGCTPTNVPLWEIPILIERLPEKFGVSYPYFCWFIWEIFPLKHDEFFEGRYDSRIDDVARNGHDSSRSRRDKNT